MARQLMENHVETEKALDRAPMDIFVWTIKKTLFR